MTDEELIARLREDDTDFWHCEAADRIEALTNERDEAVNQQDSARHSVDVLAKRGRSMIAENAKLHDRIEALEAKLAKAVEALEFLEIAATGAGVPHPKERELLQNCIRKARATLAEIRGESHE